MAPGHLKNHQPPHWEGIVEDASALWIYILPHRGHLNCFSSLGPFGISISNEYLH